MLRPDDQGLAARDRAIPGLALVLDDEALAALLQRTHPAAAILSCRSCYVRYKPGTACLVGLRVATPAGEVDAYVQAVSAGAAAKLDASGKREAAIGPLGPPGIAPIPDHGVILRTFPNDHELGTLVKLADPSIRARALRSAAPLRQDIARAALVSLRYKPERRFVGRLDADGQPRAVMKVYTEQDYPRAAASASAFRASGPLRFAALLGHSDRRRLILWEWVPGRSLHELTPRPGAAAEFGPAVGAAIATLHRQDAAPAGDLGPARFAQALAAAAAMTGALVPDLAGPADELAAALTTALADVTADPRPLHGDFSAEQMVVGEDAAMSLLDLDRAGRGDPAYDLGNFLARVEHDRVLSGKGDPAAWESAILGGYRSAGGQDPSAGLSLYTAIALLLITPEPFRKRRSGWARSMAALLRCAQEHAGRARCHA